MIYITDWFSTLLGLAGLQPPGFTDSINMWHSLSRGQRSDRKEIIHNMDFNSRRGQLWSAAIRYTNYKLVWGQEWLLAFHQVSKYIEVKKA